MKTGIWSLAGALLLALVEAPFSPSRATTATPTSVPSGCTGDCLNQGQVSVADIEVGIHLLFDQGLRPFCPAYPVPATVADLLLAIGNRASECGSVGPTHTPTSTPTPTGSEVATPTPSATPESTATPTTMGGDPTPTGLVPPAVAGRTTIVVNAMSVIPNAVTAIIAGLEFGGASALAAGEGGAAGACPLGGTATRTGSIPFLSITLSQCQVATADGAVTFNGTASINLTTFNVNITAVFTDSMAQVTRTATAMITGTVSPAFGGACSITGATLTVASGTLSVTTADDVEVGMTFQNTQVVLDNLVFNDDCNPLEYRLRFNGNAGLLTPDGEPAQVTFNNFIMDVDDTASPTLFSLAGGMTSTCFGGAVTVATTTLLAVPSDAICPTAGVLQVTGSGSVATITYAGDGAVTIDQGGMQSEYPNCLDPRLLMCLA